MLTIEHRDVIPVTFAQRMGRWVFGCDVCQDVCPHNHRLPSPIEKDFAPRPGHAWLDLARIMQTDDDTLEASLQGSPLRRPKSWGLKRNAIVVLANNGSSEARREVLRGLAHPHPVVQAQARQALERMDGVTPG
jgi:epoxyqueuosine reductase